MGDLNRTLPDSADPGGTAGSELGLHVEAPAPEVQVIRVAGELDLLSSRQLANCLAGELAHHPAYLIVDLAEVSHLGSTGLQVLVEARAAAEAGHAQLWLTGATAAVVRRPLELTGLLPLFTCHDTLDQALSELR